ncbi:MAG: PIN domain-containing protein [Nitrosopumilaceae archaeon]|nr:PIN domain-containing protein [Nitrosopumilaceae archaeon]NIU02156.1 PIN domain-containing protein [Nitrosopumilaceae archaeon]NIV66777.1 PIN domain-containing protein [Nitrosopumilaceae archaeon]NIX62757.1 PIN domain-containing protein [Nitrosopumilaceae archaeon]
MKTEKPIVVDTNIIISSLLHRKSPFLELLLTKKHQFYICELSIIELFNHKEKIIKLSKLKEDELTKVFHTLLKNLNLFKENLIEKENWQKAYQLCKDIDETDTPFVALTIELEGLLLTGDKKLSAKLKRKGFDSFYEHPKIGK